MPILAHHEAQTATSALASVRRLRLAIHSGALRVATMLRSGEADNIHREPLLWYVAAHCA